MRHRRRRCQHQHTITDRCYATPYHACWSRRFNMAGLATRGEDESPQNHNTQDSVTHRAPPQHPQHRTAPLDTSGVLGHLVHDFQHKSQVGAMVMHLYNDYNKSAFKVQHPTSNIQTFNIQHPTSNIRHPASGIRHPTPITTITIHTIHTVLRNPRHATPCTTVHDSLYCAALRCTALRDARPSWTVC